MLFISSEKLFSFSRYLRSYEIITVKYRISSIYAGGGSRTSATTGKDLFCYFKWLWFEAFTIVEVRIILGVSGVLQILLRMLLLIRFLPINFFSLMIDFKNFDEVNTHQVYSVTGTIFQFFRAEMPNSFVHAHSFCQHANSKWQLISQTSVLCQRRWDSLYCTDFSKLFLNAPSL